MAQLTNFKNISLISLLDLHPKLIDIKNKINNCSGYNPHCINLWGTKIVYIIINKEIFCFAIFMHPLGYKEFGVYLFFPSASKKKSCR